MYAVRMLHVCCTYAGCMLYVMLILILMSKSRCTCMHPVRSGMYPIYVVCDVHSDPDELDRTVIIESS